MKTPYTLKKWRPASWVVSTDTDLQPDFVSSLWSGPHRAGVRVSQSRSSMAVFLVGGATASSTSELDGTSCF